MYCVWVCVRVYDVHVCVWVCVFVVRPKRCYLLIIGVCSMLKCCMYFTCACTCAPVHGVCDYTWCLRLAPHLYMVSVISTTLVHSNEMV